MKTMKYQQLLESSRRGRLTAEEESELERCFQADPDLRQDWELEQLLSNKLRGLADSALSSNFTARVLDAVAREAGRTTETQNTPARRSRLFPSFLEGFWVRTSLVALSLFLIGLLGIQTYKEYYRVMVAESIATVATVTALPTLSTTNAPSVSSPRQPTAAPTVSPMPNLELLQDFEPIYRLSQMPSPPLMDDELLAALQ